MGDQKTIDALNLVLADAIVFYQKLHQYHWVVKGRSFFKLHEKFEELYDHWAEVMDDVAERVLTIGGKPVPTLAKALSLASIKEDDTEPDADAMVKTILADMQAQASNMKKVIDAAEAADDRGSANMMDEFRDQIEKTCWMLRAYLA